MLGRLPQSLDVRCPLGSFETAAAFDRHLIARGGPTGHNTPGLSAQLRQARRDMQSAVRDADTFAEQLPDLEPAQPHAVVASVAQVAALEASVTELTHQLTAAGEVAAAARAEALAAEHIAAVADRSLRSELLAAQAVAQTAQEEAEHALAALQSDLCAAQATAAAQQAEAVATVAALTAQLAAEEQRMAAAHERMAEEEQARI